MKYISICSGIEAATVAWHGFGWTPLAFSEIEAFPSAVLAARWPQVPNLGDMTKFAEWPEEILAECDLLVGGPPCQAFSVAGLRKSLDDDRGNITLAYVRLLNHIDEARKRHGRPPAIALYENVPGLLSTKDNAFGCLIGALAGCDEAPETETGKWPKAGYVCGEARRVGYRVLDAQYFGVAQRRRRVFLVAVPCELVASLGDRACPSEILSLRESVRGNPPARSKTGQGVAGGSEGRPRGGGEPCYLDRAMFNQGVNAQYEPQVTQDGVAGSMVARGSAAFGEREVVAVAGHEQPSVFPCIDANVDAKWGSNQWVDGGFPILEPAQTAFGGNNTSGPVDVAAALLSSKSPSGRMDFASETFAVVPEVANPLTHRMHKGINTTVDEGQTPIVTGHPDPAYAISAGSQGKGGVFGSGRDSQDTFVTCFKPSHFTRGKDGAPSDATPPLKVGSNGGGQPLAVAFSAKDHGGDASEEVAPTMRSMGHDGSHANGGGQMAVAFKPSHFTRGKDGAPSDVTPPLSADADKGDQDTVVCATGQRTHALTTRAACEEDGTGRGNPIIPTTELPVVQAMRESGQGFWMDDDIAGTLRAEGENRPSRPSNVIAQPTNAVGFNWQNGGGYGKANDGLGITEEGTGPLQRCNTPAVAYVKATNPHGKDEAPRYEEAAVSACLNGWDERHDPPKHMVAVEKCVSFKPGQSEAAGGTFVTSEFAPTMQAQNNGSTAVPAVAFANRTRDGIKVPEIMKDGVVPALTNPGGGGRADAVNVLPRSGMQVRRLTPSECEFLQGFPAGHTDIVFRKKPAADGPRYRALGNSMAVPCMFWLGSRIREATK